MSLLLSSDFKNTKYQCCKIALRAFADLFYGLQSFGKARDHDFWKVCTFHSLDGLDCRLQLHRLNFTTMITNSRLWILIASTRASSWTLGQQSHEVQVVSRRWPPVLRVEYFLDFAKQTRIKVWIKISARESYLSKGKEHLPDICLQQWRTASCGLTIFQDLPASLRMSEYH